MISYKECMNQGLLRKIAPSITQAKEQLEKAKILLEEANESFEIENYNSAIIAGYAAMFDAARSILFKDGYREKSHACVARYLEEKYKNKIGIDIINLLDQYRDQRHKVMYAIDFYPTKEEAESLLNFADKFLKEVKEILK